MVEKIIDRAITSLRANGVEINREQWIQVFAWSWLDPDEFFKFCFGTRYRRIEKFCIRLISGDPHEKYKR